MPEPIDYYTVLGVQDRTRFCEMLFDIIAGPSSNFDLLRELTGKKTANWSEISNQINTDFKETFEIGKEIAGFGTETNMKIPDFVSVFNQAIENTEKFLSQLKGNWVFQLPGSVNKSFARRMSLFVVGQFRGKPEPNATAVDDQFQELAGILNDLSATSTTDKLNDIDGFVSEIKNNIEESFTKDKVVLTPIAFPETPSGPTPTPTPDKPVDLPVSLKLPFKFPDPDQKELDLSKISTFNENALKNKTVSNDKEKQKWLDVYKKINDLFLKKGVDKIDDLSTLTITDDDYKDTFYPFLYADWTKKDVRIPIKYSPPKTGLDNLNTQQKTYLSKLVPVLQMKQPIHAIIYILFQATVEKIDDDSKKIVKKKESITKEQAYRWLVDNQWAAKFSILKKQ